MRRTQIRLTAAGVTQPVKLNYIQTSFAVALYIYLSTGATLASKVQISGDDPTDNRQNVAAGGSLTRVAAVATLNWTNHNLLVGDTIFIQGAGAPFDTGVNGAEVATVVDANNVTFAVANSGPLTAGQDARWAYLRWFDHSTLGSVTARANGNLAFPVMYTRFNVATLTAGVVDFEVVEGASAS